MDMWNWGSMEEDNGCSGLKARMLDSFRDSVLTEREFVLIGIEILFDSYFRIAMGSVIEI